MRATQNKAAVYFIRPVGLDGPVKIGCSRNILARIENLGVWSPIKLELIAAIPGGFPLERNLHECFVDAHLHHEWFEATPRPLSMLNRLVAGEPIEAAVDLNNKTGSLRRLTPGSYASIMRRQHGRYRQRVSAILTSSRPRKSFPPRRFNVIMERWRNLFVRYPTSARAREPSEKERAYLEEVLKPFRLNVRRK